MCLAGSLFSLVHSLLKLSSQPVHTLNLAIPQRSSVNCNNLVPRLVTTSNLQIRLWNIESLYKQELRVNFVCILVENHVPWYGAHCFKESIFLKIIFFLTLLKTASTALFASPSLGAAATHSSTDSSVRDFTPSRVLAAPGLMWQRRWTVGSLLLLEGTMYWRNRCVEAMSERGQYKTFRFLFFFSFFSFFFFPFRVFFLAKEEEGFVPR